MKAPVTLTNGQAMLWCRMIRRRGNRMLSERIENPDGTVFYRVYRLGRLGMLGTVCLASYQALRRRLWGEKSRGPLRAFVTGAAA